ncbi:hypothetical protein, partial [Persephonella sp.]
MAAFQTENIFLCEIALINNLPAYNRKYNCINGGSMQKTTSSGDSVPEVKSYKSIENTCQK